MIYEIIMYGKIRSGLFFQKNKKKDSSLNIPNTRTSQQRGVINMIDNNILLNNPFIPEGYYYAKVIEVKAEPSEYYFPKLLVKLKLHPMYGLPQHTCLQAILFPTDRSFYHYKNFFNTFLPGKDVDDLATAIGVWGSVEIYSSEFGDIEYSAVRFCYQPLAIRLDTSRIAKEEKTNTR